MRRRFAATGESTNWRREREVRVLCIYRKSTDRRFHSVGPTMKNRAEPPACHSASTWRTARAAAAAINISRLTLPTVKSF